VIVFTTPFYKLSGSGNDFVAFERLTRGAPPVALSATIVQALCRRGTGVGADGVMVLEPSAGAAYRLVYYNADGTRASLCGNAALCSVRLAVELGHADPGGCEFDTDAGRIRGAMTGGLPLIELAPPTELMPERDELLGGAGELRVGFARVGVPHLVVLCRDVERADVAGRGRTLRHHPSLADGANVNFVSRSDSGWAIRTFERGVEAETLACGTGSVATTTLLHAWGQLRAPGALPSATDGAVLGEAELRTRSGLVHRVSLRHVAGSGALRPSLAGAARIVFRAELGDAPA
jgi:diaminopimelate epimerase